MTDTTNAPGAPDEPLLVPPKRPIFAFITRSILLGLIPAILTFLDGLVAFQTANPDMMPPISAFIHYMVGERMGWSVENIHMALLYIGPIYTFIAIQQRSGAARPYSLNPKDR